MSRFNPRKPVTQATPLRMLIKDILSLILEKRCLFWTSPDTKQLISLQKYQSIPRLVQALQQIFHLM